MCKPQNINLETAADPSQEAMPCLQALWESFKPPKRGQSPCLMSYLPPFPLPVISTTSRLGFGFSRIKSLSVHVVFLSIHAMEKCPPLLELSLTLPSHLIPTCVPTLQRPFLTSGLISCPYSYGRHHLYHLFARISQGQHFCITGHIKNDTTQHNNSHRHLLD